MSLLNDSPLIPSNVTWKDAVTINNSKETTEDHQFSKVSLASDASLDSIFYYIHFEITVIWLALSSLIYLRITLFFFFLLHVTSVLNRFIHSYSKSRHFYFISNHFRTISHRFCFKYKVRCKSPVAFKQTGYYNNKILVFIQ